MKTFFHLGVLLSALLSAGTFLLSAGEAPAEIYKWVDENGVVHFQNKPPNEAKRGPGRRVEIIEERESASEPASPPEELIEPVVAPAASLPEPPPPEVELYTTSWCPRCNEARSFFRSRGIDFKEYDIEKDWKAERRRRRLHSSRGVPLAVINGVTILGYSPKKYEKALAR